MLSILIGFCLLTSASVVEPTLTAEILAPTTGARILEMGTGMEMGNKRTLAIRAPEMPRIPGDRVPLLSLEQLVLAPTTGTRMEMGNKRTLAIRAPEMPRIPGDPPPSCINAISLQAHIVSEKLGVTN
eukprot:g29843.t1